MSTSTPGSSGSTPPQRPNYYLTRSSRKFCEFITLINFNDAYELRGLRRNLIAEISTEVDNHLEWHESLTNPNACDCKEFENREYISREIIRAIDYLLSQINES